MMDTIIKAVDMVDEVAMTTTVAVEEDTGTAVATNLLLILFVRIMVSCLEILIVVWRY